jgi:hypothetical protein
MKKLFVAAALAVCCIACNNSAEPGTGNNSSNTTSNQDSLSGTRGTGTDLDGGTHAPGAMGDSVRDKKDTSGHMSNKPKE